MSKKIAFLDRDGVINEDTGYISRWSDFKFIPGAIEAMTSIQRSGFKIVVVTNQSGIARGLFSLNDFHDLNNKMLEVCSAFGVKISAVYCCPHHPQGTVKRYSISCACRKPSPGLIETALHEQDGCRSASFLVGDKHTDIEAARRANLGRAFLIREKSSFGDPSSSADATFQSLSDLVGTVFSGTEEKRDSKT
ncbi:MAG: HAD family hydrolase [Gammaproteobacteria bacterium]|nr:HAD family hydrolase [Gammaproteobacteria bacterium]